MMLNDTGLVIGKFVFGHRVSDKRFTTMTLHLLMAFNTSCLDKLHCSNTTSLRETMVLNHRDMLCACVNFRFESFSQKVLKKWRMQLLLSQCGRSHMHKMLQASWRLWVKHTYQAVKAARLV